MDRFTSSVIAFEQRLGAKLGTPHILLDEKRIAENYAAVKRSFGENVEIFFAVKANNHNLAIHTVEKCGGSFDIASAGELKELCKYGVDAKRVTFSNPMKVPADIEMAHAHGVRLYAADSEDEIEKLAVLAPGSNVYIRLAVDNTGSGWPLAGKFGATETEGVKLLEMAKAKGLVPYGVTFHVGSQCENPDNWRNAIERCARVWKGAAQRNIELTLLNIGGGLPAKYRHDVPGVEDIGPIAMGAVKELLPEAKRFFIEPGRFLVADAGAYVATVIGCVNREGKKKVFLDAGVFSGLMEAYESFWYPIDCLGAYPVEAVTERRMQGTKERVQLVGPTCDSVDVIAEDVLLPPLKVGDRVVFLHAGAYTNSYERYNGFAFPEVHSVAGLIGAE